MAKAPVIPVLGGKDGKTKMGYIQLAEDFPLGEYWHGTCQYGGKSWAAGGASYPEGAKRIVREAWEKALNKPSPVSFSI